MGGKVSKTDFYWSYTEEPHATRRKQILEKHPEVKKLMGREPKMLYCVLSLVAFNLIMAYLVRDCSWSLVILLAYFIGGVVNHSLSLAIHEIAHNLAFGHTRPMANRILGIFANLPIGIPMSISFRKYHLEHHKYQGDDAIDVDIPSKIETRFFFNTFTKLIWVILQPFFYGIRPLFVRPKPLTGLEVTNILVQFSFDYLLWSVVGWKSLFYLIGGSLLAMGLHPMAGHFISEHYVFVKGYETFSYYGPLNWLAFNVGYHNEHHDFPNIPFTRLSQVRKIAPEFYDDLPCHTSWSRVIWDFITRTDVGPYSRVKRIENPSRNGGGTIYRENGNTVNGNANDHSDLHEKTNRFAANGHVAANGKTNGHAAMNDRSNGHAATNGKANGLTAVNNGFKQEGVKLH